MKRIQQRIYIGRRSLNSLEFEEEIVKIPLKIGEETSFEILIINYGAPTHAHFSIGGEIRDKVMILEEKVYVTKEEKVAVITKLPKSSAGTGMAKGQIFISTGYGALKKAFTVEIVEKKAEEGKREGEERVKKRRKELKEMFPVKNGLLFRLGVSAAVTAFLLASIFISFSLSSPHSTFVFFLIASFLFLFIVLYNL